MKDSNSLYRILAIERILLQNPKGLTTKQIIDKLDNLYDIHADRKTVYSHIAVLTRFLPIEIKKRKNCKVLFG